ncbi:GntR family transcriptional regulator [Georgenia halophila]|uniref:GntR family transcriptional regulator n=1 Tax=Georgenia halophila TaxID=620889 RepID=A0ABP8LLC3_9MICO
MTVTTSKSQRAYEHLHERIESGAYGPGYRLVLDTIAREIGVSVVPVREAIRRLEAEGLVIFERNVGARVAEIDPDQLGETTQTLAVVEGAAVAFAMPQLSEDDIAEARRLNDRLRQSLDDFDPVRFTRRNEAFHRALSDPCPNMQIKALVDSGWRRLAKIRQSTFAFVPGRARESVDEHERILELLEQGADPREVELAVRDHRLRTLHAFLDRQHDGEPARPDAEPSRH